MKIKNLNKIKTLACLLSVFACTDLEEEVFSEATNENFFKTEDQVVSAIGSAYTNLYSYNNNDHMWCLNGASTDELVIPTKGTDWFSNGQWQRLHRHTWTTDFSVLNVTWGTLYFGVNTTNRLIFQLEEIGTEQSISFIPELKVFRAFYYYHLLDLFGNVPLIADFLSEDQAPATRPRQEVYDFVVSEIIENIDLLTKDKSASYGRINYYAAQAILAKVYANALEYTGTARWEECLAACRAITGSGEFSLASNYFDNFDELNEDSPEFIFAIPYDDTFARGFVLGAQTLHFNNQFTYELAYQPWNGWTSVGEFYDSYEDTDLRKGEPGDFRVRGNFLAGPQIQSNGDPVTDNAWEKPDPDDPNKQVDPDGEQVVFTPYPSSTDGLFFLRQDGARIAKFEFAKGSKIDLNNDFPIFRYSDFVLLEAEMLWRLGQEESTALMLVNTIRDRAGVAPFAELNADNLLAERGRELFAEGVRRPDLIRFGKFTDSWFEKEASDITRHIYPIPQAQIDSNPNLDQNPGY